MYYPNNSETRYSITESNLQYLNNLHYSIVNKTLDTGRIQGMAIGIIIGIFLTGILLSSLDLRTPSINGFQIR